MAVSPESMSENPIDFRAPPPSPIATSRRSCVSNDDVLTEFLEHSLRVPDLILPDKIFPKQKFTENPPTIDFQSLDSTYSESISIVLDSITRIGCFQLVNHGIPIEFVRSVSAAAAGIFHVSPEKKTEVIRSSEKAFGFEECHGEEDNELSEEFVWGRDESLKLEMERIWPFGYSIFSEKMEILVSHIEKVGEKILQILQEKSERKTMCESEKVEGQEQEVGTICCLYKHHGNAKSDEWNNSLRYDVIRMLIRGTDYSHALCLHLCHGSSDFHVYSKKGWVSFSPLHHALVITAGDQIQARSGGQYKHVIGRPIFSGEKDSISMAFLYSPSSTNSSKSQLEKTISLGQQAMIALLLTLLYNLLLYVLNKA